MTMTALLELLGRSLASALGMLGVHSPAGVIALVGVAGALGLVAVVAAATLRSVAALAASLRLRSVWSRSAAPVAGWLAESQSAPDADGRPRPRAPAVSLPVA
ncbi:hypothetical protein SAMN04515692_11460 [Leifsonia sp. CL147]|nr:hypothetical protein SAMN04515694_11461 [Leifsonia sp. CL154]SFL84031.1 hypothetical protein SAMN04515692_11460 [Leifsonia sp. CL147]